MQLEVLKGKNNMASKLRGKSEEEITKTDDLSTRDRQMSIAEPLAQSKNFK